MRRVMSRCGLVATLAIVFAAGCTERGVERERALRLRALRSERDVLRRELDARLETDATLSAVPPATGDVVIALDAELLTSAITDAAAYYLDHVELNLSERVGVHKEGDVSKKILFARVGVGHWEIDVSFPELTGLLRSGPPSVTANAGFLDLAIPVRLTEGNGVAKVGVTWDANFLSSLVCNNFSHQLRAEGAVIPRDYVLRGRLILDSDADGPIVRSELDDQHVQIDVELLERSYQRLREIIQIQSQKDRCRMVLDEAKIESRVREFVTRGFRVTLPRELQRSFALPTRYASTVEVLGRTLSVEIEAKPPTLDQTGVWSAAQVRIQAPASKPDDDDSGER